MSRIYLAGGMRGHTVANAMTWRKEFSKTLRDVGHEPVCPGIIEGVSGKLAETEIELNSMNVQVVAFDLHMVQSCDYLVANLTYAFRMPVGSLSEISWAHALGIPVILVGDNEYTKEPFIKEQAIAVVSSLEDVIPTICALEGEWNGT